MPHLPKVLVADDDVELLAVLVRHLKAFKCQIIEARDGTQAFALAKEHKPALMLLDVMMPGMSGWEVAKRVRADDDLRDSKVIVITGIGESLNAMTSPLYGVDATIDKPFEFKELDDKITRIAGIKKL